MGGVRLNAKSPPLRLDCSSCALPLGSFIEAEGELDQVHKPVMIEVGPVGGGSQAGLASSIEDSEQSVDGSSQAGELPIGLAATARTAARIGIEDRIEQASLIQSLVARGFVDISLLGKDFKEVGLTNVVRESCHEVDDFGDSIVFDFIMQRAG